MTEYLFDMFDLLVNNVFGGIFTAIIGVAVILVLIMAISRCSLQFIMYWLAFYFLVTMTLYFGGLFMVGYFILITVSLIYNWLRIVSREG